MPDNPRQARPSTALTLASVATFVLAVLALVALLNPLQPESASLADPSATPLGETAAAVAVTTPPEPSPTPLTASPTQPLTPTATPIRALATAAVSATPTAIGACMGTPAVPQLTVWSDHSFKSTRLGFLNPGDEFQVYSAYYGPGGPLEEYFYQIGYQGILAWTPALYVTLSGDCSAIPPIPGLATPDPNLTLIPQETAAQPEQAAFEFVVSGDVGAHEELLIASGDQSAPAVHAIAITVTGIPPGDTNDSRRRVTYGLMCWGDGAPDLVWGWASAPGSFRCGVSTLSDGLKWDANVVQFIVSVPAHVGYSIIVSVDAYNPPQP